MGRRFLRTFAASLLALALLLPGGAAGRGGSSAQGPARVQVQELGGLLTADGGFVRPMPAGSPDFTSAFDADGTGSFTWQFTNATGAALQNVRFVALLDADIDVGLNTFFNEVAGLAGLTLPPGAPPGAVAASSWEVDEPGFLFGDLAAHAQAGALDDSNGLAGPDDAALALGFRLGTLPAGASAAFSFRLSREDVGGLFQEDPDSGLRFYFNGSARLLSSQPTIAAAAAARRQGGPASASAVATVSDRETPAGDLIVTVSSAPAGITVTGLSNRDGTVTARVGAACDAARGANPVVLTVTDADGQTATASLTVEVTPNTPPVLGLYASPATVSPGAGLTVMPEAPPGDDGAVVAVTASAPGFTGGLAVNPATGAVAVSNAGPPGSYAVTVRAADNCGAASETVFRLDVLNQADLALAVADSPDPVRVGGTLTYTLAVSNLGPARAHGVRLDAALPEGATLLSAAATAGGCSHSGGAVSCSVGGLAAGGGAAVTLALRAERAGLLTLTAAAASDLPDPRPENNRAAQGTLVTACELSAAAPAVTHGFARSGELPGGDLFALPDGLRLSAVSRADGVEVFALDQASFGEGVPALPGLGPDGLRFRRPDATTRVVACEESLWDLSLVLAGSGVVADDTVRLLLLTPGGERELALFTMQGAGAAVTRLHPDLALYLNNRLANGPGRVGAGDFVPFLIPAGAGGARGGLLTFSFPMAQDSPLHGCGQLGIEVRRGAGAGAVSVVVTDVVVNRDERPGDRLNAGAGLLGGLSGGFPTGRPCGAACAACPPGGGAGECVTVCVRPPLYYTLFIDRLASATDLGRQAVVIGGVNSNQPVMVRNNVGPIKAALRGGTFAYATPVTPLARLNQGLVAAQLNVALAAADGSPAASDVLRARLGCYRRLADFAPVRLSNGAALTPDSTLGELFGQALAAVREDRAADMDALASLLAAFNAHEMWGLCH
jgi:uncharacterized repeat protein (TIGR01451 family)